MTLDQAQDTDARRSWIGTLAKAQPAEVEAAFAALGETVPYEWLRRPQTGLVMVRGRAGGTGNPFNLGEMTVTRAALRLADGAVGHGYVQGRNHRHAELAAIFDGLLQQDERRAHLLGAVIEPLRRAQDERRRTRSRKAAATKVDFFTMARGENAK
jgi:alpha-D-ribose 1-methylphosphonate 5-triphosphate synthase subunit PhnG